MQSSTCNNHVERPSAYYVRRLLETDPSISEARKVLRELSDYKDESEVRYSENREWSEDYHEKYLPAKELAEHIERKMIRTFNHRTAEF